jgi:cytochrome P450
MAFTMYMMALHPEYQRKVQEELDEVFQGSDRMAATKDLNKLKFMIACLKESLR